MLLSLTASPQMAAVSFILSDGYNACASIDPTTARLLVVVSRSSTSAKISSVERASHCWVLAMATASRTRDSMSPDLTVGPLVAPTTGRVLGSPLSSLGLCTLGCTRRLGIAPASPPRFDITLDRAAGLNPVPTPSTFPSILATDVLTLWDFFTSSIPITSSFAVCTFPCLV